MLFTDFPLMLTDTYTFTQVPLLAGVQGMWKQPEREKPDGEQDRGARPATEEGPLH